jgi:hypothetical protein
VTFVLRSTSYLLAAIGGWGLLLFAVAMLVHGRVWVWARAREAWHGAAPRRMLRQSRVDRRIRLSIEQPVTSPPRGSCGR